MKRLRKTIKKVMLATRSFTLKNKKKAAAKDKKDSSTSTSGKNQDSVPPASPPGPITNTTGSDEIDEDMIDQLLSNVVEVDDFDGVLDSDSSIDSYADSDEERQMVLTGIPRVPKARRNNVVHLHGGNESDSTTGSSGSLSTHLERIERAVAKADVAEDDAVLKAAAVQNSLHFHCFV